MKSVFMGPTVISPVVTRLRWPPLMPLIIWLPTMVSAHTCPITALSRNVTQEANARTLQPPGWKSAMAKGSGTTPGHLTQRVAASWVLHKGWSAGAQGVRLEGRALTSRPSSLRMYSVTTLWRFPCSALAFRKASMSSSPDSPAAFSFSRSSRRYSARSPTLVSLWQNPYNMP